MLDKREKGIIAMGPPRALRESCPDVRVREFLQRDEEKRDIPRESDALPR